MQHSLWFVRELLLSRTFLALKFRACPAVQWHRLLPRCQPICTRDTPQSGPAERESKSASSPPPRHPSCPPLVITPPATTARVPPECVSPGESERVGFACSPGVPTSHACHIWPGDARTTTHARIHAPYVPPRCV